VFAGIFGAPGGPRSGHEVLAQVCADAEAQLERLRAGLAPIEPV
jgi:hypothetical protein